MHSNEHIKKVKNHYGKESYHIIKDTEVNQQTQTEVEDIISFIDSMYGVWNTKLLKSSYLKISD